MSYSSYQDPYFYNWSALFIALIWYNQLTPEQALAVAERRVHRKPPQKLTPDMLQLIIVDIDRRKRLKCRKIWDYIESKYRVSRYEVMERL